MSAHPNPRPGVAQQLLTAHHGRTMSPSRAGRPCSPSPCRYQSGHRGSCQDPAIEADTHNSGPGKSSVAALRSRGRGLGVTATRGSLAASTTRIPRHPGARGKENYLTRARGRGSNLTRGRGARIAKPVVAISKSGAGLSRSGLIAAQNVLTDISTENSLLDSAPRPMIIPKPKSPILTSKVVPDMHERILHKIQQNKRKKRCSLLSQSPYKAPGQVPEHDDRSAVADTSQEHDRDSPVSGQDVEAYLASVFNMVDEYRSGTVSARGLFQFISNLVDLPKLDKWKLEELNRLLDPNNDNRYVDMDTWAVVGRSWVEMMMNPDYHSMSGSDKGSEVCDRDQDHDEASDGHEEALANISFGSIEGYGGGCDLLASARELELEGKVSELNFQLGKLRDEKRELERNLVASEEFGVNLTHELEDSHRRLSLSSGLVAKVDPVPDSGGLLREYEQQCCTLQRKVDMLEDEVRVKAETMANMEAKVVSLKADLRDSKEKEEETLTSAEKLKEKVYGLEQILMEKNEQIHREVIARELVEEQFEEKKMKITKLEQDLSMKEEEIKNLTETTGAASRLGSIGGSSAGNNSFSAVHDVSVDEKGLEENLKVLNNFVTPGKLKIHNQALGQSRGPSASSTPNRGNIYEEWSKISQNDGLPSPFCEKKGSKIRTELNSLLEFVKKSFGSQLEPNRKNLLMKSLENEFMKVREFMEDMFDDLPSKKDYNDLREVNKDLEERLNAANTSIENLRAKIDNNNFGCEEDDDDTAEEEVANVSIKVEAVASLLQAANSALLTQTASEVETELSLDPDTDTSGWQLDLEGVQLVGWQQRHLVRRRLSGQGLRSAFPAELSRSPVPGASKLWQSLYHRLDDLHRASELSRDLLLLAGDSLREQSTSQLQASHLVPASASKPARATEVTHAAAQTCRPATSAAATQTLVEAESPTQQHAGSECLRDDCFCAQSQARSARGRAGSRWRTMFRGLFAAVLIILIFTFLCGLEIDGELYFPVTWFSLRERLGDLGLEDMVPDPLIAVSYQTGCRRH